MVLDVNVKFPTTVNLRNPNLGLINLLQETVCFNQGKLAEYGYSASEKHKKLKEHLNGSNSNAPEAQRLLKDLDQYLNIEMKNAADGNFKLLKRYFGSRSDVQPRACIKISHNDAIIPLFRDKQYIKNIEYPLGANTGFSEIALRTGVCFIQNNIPSAIKNMEYENARINKDAALTDNSQTWLQRKMGHQDNEWIKCWERIEGANGERNTPPPETCYKSTLIGPMTLLNNQLTPEFKQKFNIESEVSLRSIYGFLCFDHQHTDYFKKDQDSAIGYIFADLFCLYLINQLVYTTNSDTYDNAKNFIEGQQKE